jgi:hypothetical protein
MQYLVGALHRPEHGTREDVRHLEELELQGRDDAEVPAPTAHGPEQVRFVEGIDATLLPVRGDHLHGGDLIGGESVGSRQPTDSSPKGVAHDTHVCRRSGQGRQSMHGGGSRHLAPQRAGFNPGGSCFRVHADTLHPRHVQQQRAIESAVGGKRCRIVAGPLDCHRQAAIASGGHGSRHILSCAWEHDCRRVLVDREVPRGAGRVPGLVAWQDHGVGQHVGERGQ